MIDNNIYIKKDNGRYEPIGVCSSKDYMYDGLWYIKHTKHSTSTTSVPYMATMFHMDTNPVDVDLICSMKDMTDKVLDDKRFRDLMSNGYSLNDMVATIVKIIYDNNKVTKHE